MPATPSFTTDLLLNAMRRGRANILQGEQGFTQGAGQDLSALFARQGLGNQQAGLTAAMAEQARRRGQEQDVEQGWFDRGLNNMETADIFGQAGDIASTGQTLTMQNLQGRVAEQNLRRAIQRIRDAQQRNELLDLLGQAAGIGVTAAIL